MFLFLCNNIKGFSFFVYLYLIMNAKSVTIQLAQRTGRKYFTSITGLADDLDKPKILSHFKKTYKCNGFIVSNDVLGEVITLTGDQKENVYRFLIDEKVCIKEEIVLRGI